MFDPGLADFADGRLGFDVGDREQVADILGGEILPLNAITREVDFAAFPADGLVQVDIHFQIQQAIVDKALLNAALGVADVITGLVKREADAILIQPGAQATPVTEQGLGHLEVGTHGYWLILRQPGQGGWQRLRPGRLGLAETESPQDTHTDHRTSARGFFWGVVPGCHGSCVQCQRKGHPEVAFAINR